MYGSCCTNVMLRLASQLLSQDCTQKFVNFKLFPRSIQPLALYYESEAGTNSCPRSSWSTSATGSCRVWIPGTDSPDPRYRPAGMEETVC